MRAVCTVVVVLAVAVWIWVAASTLARFAA